MGVENIYMIESQNESLIKIKFNQAIRTLAKSSRSRAELILNADQWVQTWEYSIEKVIKDNNLQDFEDVYLSICWGFRSGYWRTRIAEPKYFVINFSKLNYCRKDWEKQNPIFAKIARRGIPRVKIPTDLKSESENQNLSEQIALKPSIGTR